MKSFRKLYLTFLCFMLMAILWVPAKLVVNAEETVIPGYHEYIETGTERIDHWYGIARGTYLRDGTSGIKDAGSGRVSVSGTTTAHKICDTIRASVYLDESSDGGKTFGQIGSYYFSEQNTSSCHGSKANISVTTGWYYMVRGGHSATKGSTTEMITTRTGALKAS